MRWSMPILATLLVVALAGCGAGGVSGSPAGSEATPTSPLGPTSNAGTPSALPSASADLIHPPTPVPAAGGLTWERVPYLFRSSIASWQLCHPLAEWIYDTLAKDMVVISED